MSHLLQAAIARDLNELRPTSTLTYFNTPSSALRPQPVDLTHTSDCRDDVHELIRLVTPYATEPLPSGQVQADASWHRTSTTKTREQACRLAVAWPSSPFWGRSSWRAAVPGVTWERMAISDVPGSHRQECGPHGCLDRDPGDPRPARDARARGPARLSSRQR